MAADDLNAEDFGLGSDFDDALAQASGEVTWAEMTTKVW